MAEECPTAESATTEVPDEVADVVRRYVRIERPVSIAIAVAVGTVAAAAVLTLSLVAGLAVAAVVFAAVQVPVLRSRGAARLVSDADAAAVRADFEGPLPPVLAFQWGVADDVVATPDGARYEITYLFGLRSVEMRSTVESPPATGDHADADLVVSLTLAGRPWGTYAVRIDERDDETVVTATWESDRRFGLRTVPQVVIASRYRADVLAAQGYDVAEYDLSVTV